MLGSPPKPIIVHFPWLPFAAACTDDAGMENAEHTRLLASSFANGSRTPTCRSRGVAQS